MLDHTASELRLHRILYLVKYLRAMILNLVLVLIAAALFILVDIEGVYPLADDVIKSLKVVMAQNQRQGIQFGYASLAATMVLTLAFLIWMYFSITKVWRRALRIQAVVFVLAIMLMLPTMYVPDLRFSFNNLNPFSRVWPPYPLR